MHPPCPGEQPERADFKKTQTMIRLAGKGPLAGTQEHRGESRSSDLVDVSSGVSLSKRCACELLPSAGHLATLHCCSASLLLFLELIVFGLRLRPKIVGQTANLIKKFQPSASCEQSVRCANASRPRTPHVGGCHCSGWLRQHRTRPFRYVERVCQAMKQ